MSSETDGDGGGADGGNERSEDVGGEDADDGGMAGPAALPVDEDVADAAAADAPMLDDDELRELLAGVSTPADLEELRGADRSDVERALEAQASRDAGRAADRWEGKTARLSDGSVVTVVKVHTPTPAEVLDGVVPVDVEHPGGRRETVGAGDLAPAAPAAVDVGASARQAAELLSVLDAGIEAVEADRDGRAAFARSLRESVADQHRRG